ncbi:hypothetical protein [Streptomyces roseus]|uniref:hypothetical protein n=1 Tax=Streptomyces roseus TaxID=66430 RepID=UPI0037B3CC16
MRPASNEDGLRFALSNGFAESDRHTLDGATVPYVHLRRPAGAGGGQWVGERFS